MQRVLMVCLGNICRSPMAEGILRHKAEQRGILLEIDSAGTSNYHIGETPDERAVQCLDHYEIDIRNLRARQFSTADFEAFDYIFTMDQSNHRDVLALASKESHQHKVRMMLELTHPSSPPGVPDPYFGGADGFEKVFRLLEEACDRFLDEIAE